MARRLFVAFLAVVAAFIGSTVRTQREAARIDADALFISRDAAPGIQYISDARAELRVLETDVVRNDAEAVAQSRRRLDELLAKALALPTDPTEAALFARMQAEIRALDRTVERALEEARLGNDAVSR